MKYSNVCVYAIESILEECQNKQFLNMVGGEIRQYEVLGSPRFFKSVILSIYSCEVFTNLIFSDSFLKCVVLHQGLDVKNVKSLKCIRKRILSNEITISHKKAQKIISYQCNKGGTHLSLGLDRTFFFSRELPAPNSFFNIFLFSSFSRCLNSR